MYCACSFTRCRLSLFNQMLLVKPVLSRHGDLDLVKLDLRFFGEGYDE
jgi:hypothetical protein